MLTYCKDKNNICGGEKTALKLGGSAGFGIFGLKSWGAAGCIPAVQYPGWEYEDGESTALLVSQPASAHSPVTLGEIFTLTAV